MGPAPDIQRRRRIDAMLGVAVKVAAVLAAAALAIEYGFSVTPGRWGVAGWGPIVVQLIAVALYFARDAYAVATAAARWAAWKKHWLDGAVFAVGVVLLGVRFDTFGQPVLKAWTVYVVAVQVLLLLGVDKALARVDAGIAKGRLHPARLMVVSFIALIALGGVLLSLPWAASPELRHEEAHHFVAHVRNCFFTATSATCVTGLTVYDTGADFTRFGQIVILVLIQMGGLGIMALGALFGMLAGRQLSLRQSLILRESLSQDALGQITSMVIFIVTVTFACEAAGAILLYPMWPASIGSAWDRVFYSIFHAVSAFCNAGFSLTDQSLVSYRGAWGVYVCIMPLIVIGGLGFPVLKDLYAWQRSFFTRSDAPRASWGIRLPRFRPRHQRHRFSLHSKLVGLATVILIVLPALALFLFESADWRRRSQVPTASEPNTAVMADMSVADRAATALFQSVTARTAGFNTAAMDVDSMSPASHFLTCLLMFVGGSPASTAGGVKTTALAVMAVAVFNTLRRRSHVESFGRTLSVEIVRRAGVVIVVMFGVVATITLLLCYTERGVALQEILFESVSACGTVGLSTGLTPRLTPAGSIVIMVGMFAGRLGPLTVLIALTGREKTAQYEYPEESVVIG